jgi:hypothetical protein
MESLRSAEGNISGMMRWRVTNRELVVRPNHEG